ncbi:MAG: hypothetical protein ACREBJ_10305 [Nitrosotalea sp.]
MEEATEMNSCGEATSYQCRKCYDMDNMSTADSLIEKMMVMGFDRNSVKEIIKIMAKDYGMIAVSKEILKDMISSL